MRIGKRPGGLVLTAPNFTVGFSSIAVHYGSHVHRVIAVGRIGPNCANPSNDMPVIVSDRVRYVPRGKLCA